MNKFKITQSYDKNNLFLTQDIIAFYHCDYKGGGKWKEPGTIENMLCTFKNDIRPYPSQHQLDEARHRLFNILQNDLPQIYQQSPFTTICVVPRAKSNHTPAQLLFRQTVSEFASIMPNVEDGTEYIVRHTCTKTTHLARTGGGGNGKLPYKGITKDTCLISNKVRGKSILLIDDIYTYGVNIDEDAIQALLDTGAHNVIFYAVGKTISYNLGAPIPINP